MDGEIGSWLAAGGWKVRSELGDRPAYQVSKGGRLAVAKSSDAREPAAIARLAAAGLPVQRILAFEDPFLLLEWVDGERLSAAAPISAQREAGRLLRRVHKLGGGPPYHGNARFAGWIRGWLQHNVNWWKPGAEVERPLWDWFSTLEALPGTRGNDLMLMDGRPEHFVVRESRIAAIIDVTELCAGDGVMDLAVTAVPDPALLQGVLDGYGPHESRLLPLYLLMRRLSRAEWLTNHSAPADAKEILQQVHNDLPWP